MNLKPRRRLAAAAIVASALALTACSSASTASGPTRSATAADVSGITQAQKAWAASGITGASAIAHDLGRILAALSSNDPAVLSDANGTLSLDVGKAAAHPVLPMVHRALQDMGAASLYLGRRGGLPAANDWCRQAVAALSSPTAAPSPTANRSPAGAFGP